MRFCLFVLSLIIWNSPLHGDSDYDKALKRVHYLFNASFPTDQQYANSTVDEGSYQNAVRNLIENDHFYFAILRYHERLLGVGLPPEYLDEILRDDIDNRENKFAKIECQVQEDERLVCYWSSSEEDAKSSTCPKSWEQSTAIFWYPGLTAWACPSVIKVCGDDLSRCFVEYEDEDEAKHSELGTTVAFDSRFSVVKSLSKQPAGLATAVVMANYPYTKILQSGLTAVDGAIAHFYKQQHHFDLQKLHLSSELLSIINNISLTDTRFKLVYTGESYEQAGILSTFGWLRRYEKNRTRANQLYERLLCKKFTAELPRVFPQDPGNLREAPGCSGCHSSLDPLADFFLGWGEGGDLYLEGQEQVETTFNGQQGTYLSDLAKIIQDDKAFSTCTTQNVWKWMIGRGFYKEEKQLRDAFANYFITTNFSFKELVYAIATHSAFLEGSRSDATVGDPIDEPVLGEVPEDSPELDCETTYDYAADLQEGVNDQCVTCHGGASEAREDLTTETQLREWGSQVVSMMASGNMPPGQAGPPLVGPVYDLKEKIRCWLEQE